MLSVDTESELVDEVAGEGADEGEHESSDQQVLSGASDHESQQCGEPGHAGDLSWNRGFGEWVVGLSEDGVRFAGGDVLSEFPVPLSVASDQEILSVLFESMGESDGCDHAQRERGEQDQSQDVASRHRIPPVHGGTVAGDGTSVGVGGSRSVVRLVVRAAHGQSAC